MNQHEWREWLSRTIKKPLFLSQDESPEAMRLRVVQTATLRPLLAEIREAADQLLQEDMPELTFALFRLYADKGSRSEYERIYFRRRKRLTTFALLAWLEPEEKAYQEALCDAVWSICNEYTWCLPAHILNGPEMHTDYVPTLSADQAHREYTIDLFSAETAFALAEILSLTRELLPELLQQRIRQEAVRRVLRPFVHHDGYFWETATHNWASVCAGSVGAAALYLLQDADELAAVLSRVRPAMESYLKGFKEDGACTEGYLYWQYGFGYYVYFADLLKQRTGGALDLFQSDQVRSIALFQQKCFLDARQVVNFSDSLPEAGIFMGLSHYLKQLYPEMELPEASLRANYNDDHCCRWAPAIRNLLWVRAEGDARGWSSASYYLENAQWFVSRHWTESGRYAFAAKGGHNDEPHNHNDIGHFIIYANGSTLLADLGSGQYNREYFGPERYTFLCNGSQGHSVPMINGLHQRNGAVARAELLEMTQAGERDVFAIQYARAYTAESLRSLTRRFTWIKSEQPKLELEDRFLFDEAPRSIVERFISWSKPIPAEDGSPIIKAGNARLSIQYNSELMDWTAEELLHTDHYGNKVTCYALDFTLKKLARNQEVKLTFLLH